MICWTVAANLVADFRQMVESFGLEVPIHIEDAGHAPHRSKLLPPRRRNHLGELPYLRGMLTMGVITA
jgi:hypothetical protein